MQDLQLIGVHEDGEHLLLSGADDSRFLLPVDEALRAAIRRDRPHLGQQQIEADGGLRPRDVQSLIRAGASTEEAASRAGWTVEKVHRYEGPILAEREHVAGLAQKARLRTRSGVSSGGAPTLSARVAERLKSRDVEVTETVWDSWRADGGPWTVVLTFAAGGRQRQASWTFDLADRTVSAVDDEARWLSEEVQTAQGPIPAPPRRPSPGRDTTVYDVEAEGGLLPVSREEHQDHPLDLMSAMRKRSSARSRRRPGVHNGPRTTSPRTDESVSGPDHQAVDQTMDQTMDQAVDQTTNQTMDQALPLQDLEYDAATTPAPAEAQPSHDPSRPVRDQEQDGQPPAGASGAAGPDEGDGGSSPVDAPPDGTPPGGLEKAGQEAQEPPALSQTKARKRPAREATRKTGRPSVPAWDEIMFGSRPGADRSSS